MEDILKNAILKSKLFAGLSEGEVTMALNCFNRKVKTHPKDAIIFSQGDTANHVIIVLSGEVELRKTDFSGNSNIISKLYPGDIIGAAALYSSQKTLPFDVYCLSDCAAMYLESKNILKQCGKACLFHAKIIENLFSIVSDKNIQLSEKIDILTKRTLREKLLAYLYFIFRSSKAGSLHFLDAKRGKAEPKSIDISQKRFFVGLSRREMADYLSVNRSALIRELVAMRNEGIIGFEDNIFWFNNYTCR